MNQKKLILGLVGEIASGKGAVAKYLKEKHNASTHRFSTMLRDALNRFYIPSTRQNLVKLSEIMRQNFGQDLMAKVIAQDAGTDQSRLVVVEGIRRIPDITYLRELPEFKLVKIIADPKTRYSRLIKRGENPDDNSKTYEQFLADHQLPTELTIPEVMERADITINNNGTVEELYNQVEKIIAKT